MDWSDGSYERTATILAPATKVALDALGPLEGLRLLDVGCGTGNVALEAARRGALVSAIDPAARLVEVTRERAEAESLRVTATVAEAAALPFADASFDALVSVFAVIFAPDAEAAAREMVRVLRPGGRLALTAWTPHGAIAEAGAALWRAASPPGGEPPKPRPSWVDDAFVRGLFGQLGASVEMAEHSLAFEAESAQAWFDDQEANHPMWRGVKRLLEARPGAWDALRAESLGLLERGNEVTTGFRATSRYKLYTMTRA
ncbi:MAG TPA: methyltransferase domain-containing protein [Polyangiaceae bacterium]|nr:methyltransferase domain-containing protein [Polyangiaceae bacterium]